ncbi:hypothetical protein Y032_0042g514 [Ancylostoma ceylanicum]|uniref:Uncharacterized protein n=1 Tax=Ancylostoma ceylanicum TaxID=53326 RepID=A0A016UFS6_9BILA|nr:hypothetical protein Y032_0042g514 [Ancylostoma ceylanicum]
MLTTAQRRGELNLFGQYWTCSDMISHDHSCSHSSALEYCSVHHRTGAIRVRYGWDTRTFSAPLLWWKPQ